MPTFTPNVTRARVRVPAGDVTVSIDPGVRTVSELEFPCREFSITDDVMNIADSACVTVSNVDGENTGKFKLGQLITIDLQNPIVGSKWARTFTGRITALSSYSDIQGGTNIMITAMDLGWHLTSSHGVPFTQIRGCTFAQLLEKLIDPSWKKNASGKDEFFKVAAENDTNRRIKHGRVEAERSPSAATGQVKQLPLFIQVEPGQAPFELIQMYAAREGVLVNVGADGSLIFFRPHYDDAPLYFVEYHGDANRTRNTVVGRPTLSETIDELYTEVQCLSTVILKPKANAGPERPNEQYTRSKYLPSDKPFDFVRRHVLSDSEAINSTLRLNRAKWKQRMGLFNSWTYEVEFDKLAQRTTEHSNNGTFFCSDTMVMIHDSVHQVNGVYYVQSVQRSVTLDGEKTKMVIKKPGLLTPTLAQLGGGSKKALTKKQVAELAQSLKI